MPDDRYTHGHHHSVIDSHATRSVANSAAYLLPHLHAGLSLLDVGCGPGSITTEFADLVAPGRVLGIDRSEDVIKAARTRAPGSPAEFATMDLYALDIADDAFDIVHAHQVLQHVTDPVAALREMGRVVRPGGIIAVRDADYAAMHWAPASESLTRWLDVYRAVAKSNGAEPDAGRHLIEWARAAGFDDITPTVDTWLYADPAGRTWLGSTWAERVVSSSLATQAVETGLASTAELDQLANGWRTWADDPNGWFVMVHGELIIGV